MVLVAEVDPLAERQRHHHQRDGDPGQGEEQRQAAQPRLAQWPCRRRGGECFSRVHVRPPWSETRLLHEGIRARTA
ncbi:hypothetical protein P4114_16565 [Pseudomonas aeruginosa]|nr:hypothetical protein [Pseudomonas aeruginosa]